MLKCDLLAGVTVDTFVLGYTACSNDVSNQFRMQPDELIEHHFYYYYLVCRGRSGLLALMSRVRFSVWSSFFSEDTSCEERLARASTI